MKQLKKNPGTDQAEALYPIPITQCPVSAEPLNLHLISSTHSLQYRIPLMWCVESTSVQLPEGPFFLLRRNFNDTRLVDDSSCSVPFLNNPNDPGLISFLLLNFLAVGCSLFSWKTNQKSSCMTIKEIRVNVKSTPTQYAILNMRQIRHEPEVSADPPWSN